MVDFIIIDKKFDDTVKRDGPNANRLTFELIHKDYVAIVDTGISLGEIFSWTVCSHYLWTILVLVLEVAEIFRLSNLPYGMKNQESETDFMSESNPVVPFYLQILINVIIHLTITTIR